MTGSALHRYSAAPLMRLALAVSGDGRVGTVQSPLTALTTRPMDLLLLFPILFLDRISVSAIHLKRFIKF
jgi:hypothetical protein